MKVLILGDVFGSVGREMLEKYLSKLKKEHEIDLTIVNIENTTNGKGLSFKHYKQLKELGIDIMTSGNHIFDREETIEFIKQTPYLLRPLNSNPFHPGNGTTTITIKSKEIRITNLLGTALINKPGDNPYFALENLILENNSDIHLVDFHAQSTAEKRALAIHFDGQVEAIWGTHTHVQTADEEIMPKGTAFITDIGMTGSSQGVIGAEPEAIIKRSRQGFPASITPHLGKGQINGIILKIDENTNKAVNIKRLFFKEK